MQFPNPNPAPPPVPAPAAIPAAAPVVPAAPGAPPASPTLPDPGKPYRGWYPRWWFLSALFCSLLVAVITLLQYELCTPETAQVLFCQVGSWTDWRQGATVALIWVFFLSGWLISYVFGVTPIEVSGAHQRGSLAKFFRTISQFKTIYILLLIYSGLALLDIIVTWYQGKFQAVAFALSSIIIFVANSNVMYRREPAERRMYMIGYALMAAGCMGVMFIIGKFQAVLFAAEVIIICTGCWAIWSLVFQRQKWANPAAPTMTPQQALLAANKQATTPIEIFLALIRAMFR